MEMVVSNRIHFPVEAIVHLGACSNTTEQDAGYLLENNFHFTSFLLDWVLTRRVRFIYASSAATYGDGSLSFSDEDEVTRNLQPINMYGYSKQLFDLRVLREELQDRVAGVKFFNIFGPNEYHKGDMTSVVFKAFHQIREAGKVRLFKSYKPEYGDGGQKRDFVYVKDCVEVLWWLLNHPEANGIFNLGTGRARTWNDLIQAVYGALSLPPAIDYIEMPEALQGQYQYFTEARMDKLRAAGCPVAFRPLEDAVGDYVKQYLSKADPYL
jgi:ADP-L-glycero-D-manno-heptose 6-epimerase